MHEYALQSVVKFLSELFKDHALRLTVKLLVNYLENCWLSI